MALVQKSSFHSYLEDHDVCSETLETTALPEKRPEMTWLSMLWKG